MKKLRKMALITPSTGSSHNKNMKTAHSREKNGSPVPSTLETGGKTKSTASVSKPMLTAINMRVIGKII